MTPSDISDHPPAVAADYGLVDLHSRRVQTLGIDRRGPRHQDMDTGHPQPAE